MKPIKLLLSLCAMLVVTVGAWGQVSSTSAPSPAPASACGGSSTLATVETTLTLNPLGTCTVAQVRLDILGSGGATVASGATVAMSTGTTVALPPAVYPNVAGNYSLQATIVSITGAPGCTPVQSAMEILRNFR